MQPLDRELTILGIAQVATEELLAAQLKIRSFDEMKKNISQSVYWPDFCRAVAANQVPADWLDGKRDGTPILGRVVLGWAKDWEE